MKNLKILKKNLRTEKNKNNRCSINYDIEETIQKQSVLITVTLQGYIKRGSLNNVKQQKRGGKGKSGITTRDRRLCYPNFIS